MIHGKQVSWRFGLNQANFKIRAGRITTFMGYSGAGKTTLLKCIANLYSHYEGIITFQDMDIRGFDHFERASHIGFVLQQFHLFPHLDVLRNCTIALPKQDGLERALFALETLEIAHLAKSYPSELSGGQQQRVAIARALAMQPKVLIFDEPTSSLDPESKKTLERLLLELHAKGVTIALSSHDMPFIRNLMDYIYFLENGKIIEEFDAKKDHFHSESKIQKFMRIYETKSHFSL